MKLLISLIFLSFGLFAQNADELNENSENLRERLKAKYFEAAHLKDIQADEADYRKLLEEISSLREKLGQLDKKFILDKTEMKDETGFWDQGETTLSQLIIEYGSGDCLYVIPPELSNMKLQLYSMVPIPRIVWDEMLELILSHNGIGVKKINSFAKQLFILKHDPTSIGAITDKFEDLQLIEDHVRVLYVVSPSPEKIKSTQSFFERFSDPKQTSVQAIGSKVVIISSKQNLEKLVGIYKTVWEKDQGKIIRVCTLNKLPINQAEEVLKRFFSKNDTKTRPSIYQNIADELQLMSLSNALVLIGEKATVDRAEKILKDLEDQLQDPKEMTVFWYQCKHTDPEDLARLLEQVYDSLFSSGLEKNIHLKGRNTHQEANTDYDDRQVRFGNFIVDSKTGSIMMVIRRDDIPKIKSVLKRLDIPKRMVEIEVILVEKKLQDRKQLGINLLKLGQRTEGKKASLSFDANENSNRKGLLDFIISTPKAKFPSFDLTFSLLMAQENVHLHANPTLVAMNQTPATFSIVEEISINNGVQLDNAKKGALGKSFTRAQYGTTILITPMIHFLDDEEEIMEKGFVTLQTNITFETTQMSQDDRPPVTRRHVENEVRIADGETIVIGGLRRKSTESNREKIPFLGDIPGIGKLFGTTKTSENNTEMFIFITPRILKDPSMEKRLRKKAKLEMRSGDREDVLRKIREAKVKEKKYALQEGMQILFDQFET